jgi:copper transport protein
VRTVPPRLAALLALGLALLAAGPASAHAALLQTTPTNGVVLPASPREVLLRYSEPVTAPLGAVRVFAPSGKRVDTGVVAAREGGHVVAAPVAPGLGHGTYVVAWRVVSADSHPVAGTFSFSVGHTSDPYAAARPAGGVGRRPLDVARFAALGGLVLLLGCAAFGLVVAEPSPRLAWAGWGLATAGAVAALLLQGPYGAGLPATRAFDTTLLGDVAGTRYGAAALARIGVLAVAVPPVLRRRTAVAVAGPALLVATSLTGHAGTGGALALAADATHLAAACAWLGGLACLVAGRGRLDAAPLHRWSRAAAAYVAVLVGTGTYGAWREVGAWADLTGTAYGRLVVAKVALLAAMLACAVVARRRLRSRITDLGRVVAAEAVAGVAVVAVTAVLVGTPPASAARLASETAVVAGALRVQVDVDPARSGVNQLHVYYTGEGSKAVDVAEVRARFFHGGEVVAVDVPRKSLGHYEELHVPLPASGTWRLELVTRTSDVDSHTTVLTFRLR